MPDPQRRPVVIKHDPKGRRFVRPYMGVDKWTGKPWRPYHRIPDNLSDAEALADAQRFMDQVELAAARGGDGKVGSLLQAYVEAGALLGKAERTTATYRTLAGYCAPIAHIRAEDLTTADVAGLYTRLAQTGGGDHKGLSPNTLKALHWFLCGAFAWMQSMGLMKINPAREAPHSTGGTVEEMHPLDHAHARRVELAFIEAVNDFDQPLDAAAAKCGLMALWLGMRVGECCAARPMDIVGTAMHVCGTVIEPERGVPKRLVGTKGKRGATVKSRKVSMTKSQLHTILGWCEAMPDDGPVAYPLGGGAHTAKWLRPSDVSTRVVKIARAAGVPLERFHDLRHTHATLLIMAGVDIRTVSERLGHADVATTLRIYAHVLPGRDQAAANAMGSILGEGDE